MMIQAADGTSLYTKSAGDGPPCLYIHGGPGAWSYHFEALGGNALEASLRMIYLDQRGCGRSTKPEPVDYRLDTIIDDFETVREAYGFEEWNVLAHSFGGILAVRYAMRFPERIQALILMNSTLCMPHSLRHQTTIGCEMLRDMGDPFTLDETSSAFDQWYSVASRLLSHDQYYRLQYESREAYLLGQNADSLLMSDPSFQHHVFASTEYMQDFREATAHIQIPALVIAGAHDHAIGPTHHEGFRFPHQEVALLCGKHVPYQENTAQWLAVTEAFIRKNTPSQAK